MPHTPGPWIDRHWDGNQQITITAVAFRGPNALALVRPPLTLDASKDFEFWTCTDADVTEAGCNARLIAASPDLLAACESALEHIMPTIAMAKPSYDQPPEPVTNADYEADQVCCFLTLAIRKAKGESP